MTDETYDPYYLVCPYCKHSHGDMWESGLQDDTEEDWECSGCGEVFIATKSVSITYEGRAK